MLLYDVRIFLRQVSAVSGGGVPPTLHLSPAGTAVTVSVAGFGAPSADNRDTRRDMDNTQAAAKVLVKTTAAV